MLADRILAVERSPFYSIMDLAAGRKDCIYLQLGEPDFTTPSHILEAAKKALDAGYTHYAPDRGDPELRQLVTEKIEKDQGAQYDWRDELLITAGGQAALHIAVMATVNPGDEVIILVPYYPPYLVNATLAGAKAVLVELKSENDFIPDPAVIEHAITPKTKAMIVLSPNNPTGAIYPEDVLGEIIKIAQKHKVTIIADEVYDSFVYSDDKYKSMVSFPDAKDVVVQVNSFSKVYAMTGLRVGYLAASKERFLQFLKYHHTINISANAPSQKACITALTGPQDCVAEMKGAYRKRRDIIVERLNDIPGVHCFMPQGAFYAFADIRELGIPSLDLVQYLVKEAGVVLTNGSGFGCEGFIRVSYAADIAKIEEAMDRMKKAIISMPSSLKRS